MSDFRSTNYLPAYLPILLTILIVNRVESQNRLDWIRYYDNNSDDAINDIYAVSEGGYVTTGHSNGQLWLNKLADDGDIVWSNTYAAGNPQISAPWTIIETEDGSYLSGMARNGNFSAILVDRDGEQLWWKDYGAGICHALIELKSGEFMILGHADGQHRLGCMIMVDNVGDTIWTRTYDPGGFCDLYYMRETAGGVIATGMATQQEGGEQPHLWILKIDFNGDIVWEKHHRIGPSTGRGIAATIDGGFVITGHMEPEDGTENFFLMYINGDGEQQWLRVMDTENETSYEQGWAVYAPRRGGYAVVGGSTDRDTRISKLKMVFTTQNGVELWKRLFSMEGSRYNPEIKFFSVIRGHDNSMVAAGMIDNTEDETGYDGVIVKLIEERVAPLILYWEPHALDMTVLPDSVVTFLVRAEDPQDDAMTYLWTINQTEISTDTTVQVIFQDMGEYLVECAVSDGEHTTTIGWTVHVDDLFIVDSSPDTLDILVRRSTSTNFSIDEVICTEGNDPSYVWLFTDVAAGQTNELGYNSSIMIDFPMTGDYLVEGRAYRHAASDAVIWNVRSRGAILEFGPMEDTLFVQEDSLVHFGITLTNPQNNNYYIRWRVNGELVLTNEINLDWTFNRSEIEYSRVRVIVSDRIESDTLAWYVAIRDLNVGDGVIQPNSSELLTVSPNPFNSTVTLRFVQSPHAIAGGVGGGSLTIHDISGREVANFDGKGKMEDGTGVVIWDAASFPAGIYFARLASGSDVQTVKMVLVR